MLFPKVEISVKLWSRKIIHLVDWTKRHFLLPFELHEILLELIEVNVMLGALKNSSW